MTKENMDLTESQVLRAKAEERLNIIQRELNTSTIETDVKKLLYELQVHQIELEIQKEELSLAYQTAEAALKNFTMLFDLAPIGYFILDSDCSICELNFAGADMLEERRFSLLNSNFRLFITEDSKPVFNNFFNNVYTTTVKESCELTLGYDNKPLRTVYMEGIVTGDDLKCLLSVVDISKFKVA